MPSCLGPNEDVQPGQLSLEQIFGPDGGPDPRRFPAVRHARQRWARVLAPEPDILLLE